MLPAWRKTLVLSVFILSIALQCFRANAGYWEDQFAFPSEFQSVPAGSNPPDWSKTINVIGILQLRDDLGRQQADQLDRLSRRMGEEIDVGIYSIDRGGPFWTPEYIVDVRYHRRIGLPVFEIPPDAMREFYRGFQPKPAEIYPQVRIFSGDRRLLGTLRGVQTTERIEQAVEEARKALSPWFGPIPASSTHELVTNGDFEKWEQDQGPTGWRVNETSGTTIQVARGRGWNITTAMEIRAESSGTPSMAFQPLSTSESLSGKRLRLSAAIQTNCIARPVVTLAIAHPKVESQFRFLPSPPFQTTSGKSIPMRMIGTLDYRVEQPAWKWANTEFVFPSDTEIPANLLHPTIFIYFNNPKDIGGAALIDEVRLEVLD